jgi:EAL domain-containing protein (putative c-di-GMP-specific phosphodiesterase class I)
MAGKLRSFAADIDHGICGRLNGSDFAVVIPGTEMTLDALATLTADLIASDSTKEITLPLAVGSAGLSPGITLGKLFANADAALAKAENDARGFSVHEEDEASTSVTGQQNWRKDLQETLDRRQIITQPQPVSAADGTLLHQQMEIHIAWGSQDTYFPPSEWLPYAVRTGMASAIEEIAIEQCIQQAETAQTMLALRLSEPTLRDASVLAHLVGLISSSPAAANRLCIEIPESLVFKDPEFGMDLGKTLRRTGARVGLADAGVYFTRIPSIPSMQLDHIKIAASLSASPSTSEMAYLAGIVSMAHGMGIKAFLCRSDQSDADAAVANTGADGVVSISAA